MTMNIDSRQQIAGVPILEIRRFLRHHEKAFRREWLIQFLHLDIETAEVLLDGLVQQGFVVRKSCSREGEYEMTDLGRQLCRSSAAKRVSRKTADEALKGIMARVEEVNANPKYLYSVRSLVVFGSYLSGEDRLGDLDVAVELSSRVTDGQAEASLAYSKESGRRFNTFVDQLYWAQREILLMLKARQRTISIQDWHSFLGMKKDKNFQYRVLIGDADRIANDLESEKRPSAQPQA